VIGDFAGLLRKVPVFWDKTLCRLAICYPHVGGAFYFHFWVKVVYPKNGLSKLFETSVANHQSKKRRTPDDCNRYQLYDRPRNLIKMRSIVLVVTFPSRAHFVYRTHLP